MDPATAKPAGPIVQPGTPEKEECGAIDQITRSLPALLTGRRVAAQYEASLTSYQSKMHTHFDEKDLLLSTGYAC